MKNWSIHLRCIFVLKLGMVFAFTGCRSENLPESIPPGASYDRKKNLYQIIKNGKQLKYYKDGSLYEVCEVNKFRVRDGYCEGFLNGVRIHWGNFKNGQRDGLWVWTFENGAIYVRQNYRQGSKKEFWIPVEEWGNEDGLYERFFPNGRLEEKGFFKSGYRTGNWVRYYPSGQIEYLGSYSEGKRVNEWFYYYPNGKTEALEKFTKDGELIERITFYPDGQKWCHIFPDKSPICNDR